MSHCSVQGRRVECRSSPAVWIMCPLPTSIPDGRPALGHMQRGFPLGRRFRPEVEWAPRAAIPGRIGAGKGDPPDGDRCAPDRCRCGRMARYKIPGRLELRLSLACRAVGDCLFKAPQVMVGCREWLGGLPLSRWETVGSPCSPMPASVSAV